MKYRIVINDGINLRGYISNSRNVLKHAYNLGHADDRVTVYSVATGRVLSRAVWDCSRREYIRVTIAGDEVGYPKLDYIEIG